jgi:hypothetical protein
MPLEILVVAIRALVCFLGGTALKSRVPISPIEASGY